MSKNIELIEQTITPIVETCGCRLLEVELARTAEGRTLTVFIVKDGGVTIEDCERVHNEIAPIIDGFSASSGESYSLSVSSFGLTRQLKNTKEFEYRLGEQIEVKLFVPVGGEKEFFGKLTYVDDEEIEICDVRSKLIIPRRLIASAKLKLDF